MRVSNIYMLSERLCLLVLSLFFGFLALNGDTWMYRSDVLSLISFISGVSFLFALSAGVFGFLIGFLGQSVREFTLKILSVLVLGVFLSLFLILSLDFLIGDRWKGSLFYGVAAVLFLASLVGSYNIYSNPSAKESLGKLSRIVFVSSLVVFPILKCVNYVTSLPDRSEDKRGVVLIVVDRLSAKYLKPFNAEAGANTPHLNRFAEESLVYTHARTNGSDTFNAFRALYSAQYETATVRPDSNLIHALQEGGVQVRLLVSHNDATPDIRGLTYKGIRSYFLTENHMNWARLLGLDYHVMFFRSMARGGHGKAGGWREKPWREALNQSFEARHPLKILMSEIWGLEKADKSFFVLCHFIIPTGFQPIEETINADSDDRLRIRQNVINNKNVYPASLEWWAKEEEKKYIGEIESIDRMFGEFWFGLKAFGSQKEIDVFFTSDHGSSFEDGKIWYGYHLNEAVTRIPLIWHRRTRDNSKGVDPRQVDLTDLSETIVSLFGLEALGDKGVSFLEPPSKDKTVVFGANLQEGSQMPDQYALIQGNEKYIFKYNAKDFVLEFMNSKLVSEDFTEVDHPAPDQNLIQSIHGKSPWEAF